MTKFLILLLLTSCSFKAFVGGKIDKPQAQKNEEKKDVA
jgi:hypothetical protein